MSPVSAWASKWIIDTRPWPSTLATPLASGKAIEWSPPSTTGIAPERVTFSTAASSRGSATSMSPGGISTSPASTTTQVAQRVGAQRERGARAVVGEVVGRPDRLRPEPGAGPVRGAAVERRPEHDHVGVGVRRLVVEVAARDAEERDVGPELAAVPRHLHLLVGVGVAAEEPAVGDGPAR